MKKKVLTISSFLIFITAFSQKTEYRIALNSGLFSFSGNSAGEVSSINYSDFTNRGYTNNPYGSKKAFCYGVSANLTRVSKRNFLFGLELGYQLLRSKILIDKINGHNMTTTYQLSADGRTYLNFSFINLQPFLGYRFALKQVDLDIRGGIDFAYCLRAREKGNATAENDGVYETSVDRKTIAVDIRPGFQLSASFRKFGIYSGYSFGQMNYKSGYIGGPPECYSRLLRFGVTYLLK